MDNLTHINHKIVDALNGRNSLLKIFHNGYRFDCKLDIIKSPDGKQTSNLIDLDNFSVQRDKRPNRFARHINHSYEPLDHYFDLQCWIVLRNDNMRTINNKFNDTLIHSEKNSEQLDLLNKMGFKGAHWFANGYLCAKHWFSNYKDIRIVTERTPIVNKFICPARLIDNQRKYRIQFLNMLNLEQGIYSLLERDPQTQKTPEEIYPRNKVSPSSFDSHENSSAWINVIEFVHSRWVPTIWKSSFLHVVLETVVDRQHLTEKIFKPIVLRQPFVLVGGIGSLEYLRSYGFKTFGSFWDESYDEIENLDERMQAIADIVNNIGAMSLNELESMRTGMQEILDHNYNRFYNGFSKDCWQELSEQLSN
jgi:hypothetical protein